MTCGAMNAITNAASVLGSTLGTAKFPAFNTNTDQPRLLDPDIRLGAANDKRGWII